MARNIDRMSGDDFPVRGGKHRYRKAVLNEDPKAVVSSAKGDDGRVGIPTRQPTASLVAPKLGSVGIPTRQPTAPLATKRMNLVAKAKQKIQGRAPVEARRVTPAVAMSKLARRPTLRTKR
jgi:hypothetical protein